MYTEKKTVQYMKDRFKPGSRVLCVHMREDPRPIPDHTFGSVRDVDDIGQLHCVFDNGYCHTLVPDVDTFFLVNEYGEDPWLQVRPMTSSEMQYCYTHSQQISQVSGCIGHLRADMDTDGNGFFSGWDTQVPELKSQEFVSELDEVIAALRFDPSFEGILKNRNSLALCCRNHPESAIPGEDHSFGFRADTKHYTYMLRLNPHKGEYNLYCYCYLRKWLEKHMRRAEKGIRIIDTAYNDLFRCPDGGQIQVVKVDATHIDYILRFIDEYHFEATAVGASASGYPEIYHICQFAEISAANHDKEIRFIKS